MSFFGNKRRDFSIQPPRQQVDGTPFFVTDSSNIDFTLENLNLTADLTLTGVTAGTYGDATNIPVLQIDQWGRVTGVTLIPVSGGGGGIDGANSRRWTGLNTFSAPPPGLARLRTTAGATTDNPSAVIDIRISRYDETNADMQAWFTALNNYRTANPGKAYIQITDSSDNSVFGIYQIGNMAFTSSPIEYWLIGLTYISGSVGLFTSGSTITFSWVLFGADGTGGSGVTSVSAGTGMNFTTITSSGNVDIDITKVPYIPAGFSTGLLKWDGSAWVFDNNTYLTTISGIAAGGDLNGTYTDPTVAKLRGEPITTTTPTIGKILQYNGTEWALANIPTSGSGGGGVFYYFNYQNYTNISPTTGLPTTPVPPSQLGIIYDAISNSIISGPLTQGVYTLVCGFVTIVGTPGITTIPAGLWDFNIWADVVGGTGGSNQTQFQIRVYKYDSITGTYGAPIASSDPIFIYDPTVIAQYIGNVTMPQTTLLVTDRIYIEFWAQKNVNQLREVSFHFGTNTPSHVHTTIPSVTGTGLVKVVNSVYQSPATLLFNADVDTNAAIAVNKLSMSTDRLLGRTTASSGAVEEIQLTTTGTSGPATLIGATLNIPQYSVAASATIYYGDGFDGTIILNGTNTYTSIMTLVGSTYTLSRSIFPSSLTVNAGITLLTNGYQITCNGTTTINGTVGSVGNNGGNAVAIVGNFSTAGSGATSLKNNSTVNDQILVPSATSGGNGNNGSGAWGAAGVSINVTWYYYGSLGGGGGRGWTNATTQGPASTVTVSTGKFLPYPTFSMGLSNHIGWLTVNAVNFGGVFISAPGAGGGAGANLAGGWGGAGGGGGGNPYGVKILSNLLSIGATGIIRSNGGNGGNGCAGNGANWAHGAGGGGAAGGIVYLVTNSLTYTPANNIQAKRGIGGTGGFGAGTGAALYSTNGSNGADGYIIIVNTTSGISTFYTGQY